MKKSAKPLILSVLFVSVLFALLFLGYVGIKLKCENFIKEKVIAEENLSSKKNKKINLLAQHQVLTAEERIVSIAVNELGMIKNNVIEFSIISDPEKIEEIYEIIKEKYD